MYRSLMFIAVVALVAGLSGCSGTDNGEPIDQALVGEWQIFEAQAGDETIPPDEIFGQDEGDVRWTVQFRADGVVTERRFNAEGEVTSTNTGDWTAAGGEFDLTFPDDEHPVEGTYQIEGNILTVTTLIEEHEVSLRFVRVVDLTEQDPHMARNWEVAAVEVNGVATPLPDYFDLHDAIDTAVLLLHADGTFDLYGLEGAEIRGGGQGNWATGGGAINFTADGQIRRGAYAVNSASMTFLDIDGSSVRFALEAFVTEGTERDESLIGAWQAASVTVNDQPAELADVLGWPEDVDGEVVRFYSDGVLVAINYKGEQPFSGQFGTWNTDGNVLTLNLEDLIVMDSWSVVGDTATFDFTLNGDAISLTCER